MATVQNAVLHKDLTDQQITTIQKKIVNQAKADEFFDKFCEKVPWKKGSVALEYRRLIYPKVDPKDVKAIEEDVAPRPTSIEYATFRTRVLNYRDKFIYTRESTQYNYDDVVRDGGEVLSYKTTQKLDYIKGAEFLKSKATLTAESSILATLRKAKLILKKNKAKYWINGKYLAIMTPETLEKLQDELEAKGVTLDEATKEEILEGVISSKKGFVFAECPSDILHNEDGTHSIIFMGKTFEGKKPVTCRQLGDVEVINNPLGSGLMVDEDGNFTSDDNHQRGSIAVNIDGLGCHINDDMAILNTKFAVDTVEGNDFEEHPEKRSGYVSKSSSPKTGE
jgi:hypothetical protein